VAQTGCRFGFEQQQRWFNGRIAGQLQCDLPPQVDIASQPDLPKRPFPKSPDQVEMSDSSRLNFASVGRVSFRPSQMKLQGNPPAIWARDARHQLGNRKFRRRNVRLRQFDFALADGTMD
jgi:hypothetical protein